MMDTLEQWHTIQCRALEHTRRNYIEQYGAYGAMWDYFEQDRRERMMRLRCFYCGKVVSTEVPDDTVVRAVSKCPECVEKEPREEEGDTPVGTKITPLTFAQRVMRANEAQFLGGPVADET